jgi:hypothetical protein
MPHRDSAPAEADHESRPASDQPRGSPEQRRRQVGMAIQPHQFPVSRQVTHHRIVGGIVPRHEDLAKVGVDETTLHR